MADVVAQLRPLCDVILLEAPSTSAGAKAQSLGKMADGAPAGRGAPHKS